MGPVCARFYSTASTGWQAGDGPSIRIFHIPHWMLRRYLAEQCSRILIFDPEEIWFDQTLQGTVLLLAEKKRDVGEMGQGVGVVRVASRAILESRCRGNFSKSDVYEWRHDRGQMDACISVFGGTSGPERNAGAIRRQNVRRNRLSGCRYRNRCEQVLPRPRQNCHRIRVRSMGSPNVWPKRARARPDLLEGGSRKQ